MTIYEFAYQYKIVDDKEIYTNGTELIPIFRVKQWLEHSKLKDIKLTKEMKRICTNINMKYSLKVRSLQAA